MVPLHNPLPSPNLVSLRLPAVWECVGHNQGTVMKEMWQVRPFEECITKVTYTSKIQRRAFLEEGAYPIVSQEDDFINGYWDDQSDVFKVTTPIVVFGDHTKILKYVDFDFVLGADGVKLLQPSGFLLPKFFFYQLQTATLDSLGYARHYKLLKELQIAYPTLPEQRRIVGILDEAFEGIATGKANAEKNLQNARALFESHLQSVFTNPGEEWGERQLGEVCDFEGGSQPPKSQFLYAPKAGYVRFLQIRDFGGDKHVTYIRESPKNRSCREDDIMIGRYGASVGKILTGKSGAYNVALMKTIPDREVLDRAFFYHYLASNAFQELLRRVADRSAQNGFSKEDIFPFPVPVPTLREQRAIVDRLEPLREETRRLESTFRRKLAALEALKKSLLHQAFTGQL